MFTPQDINRLWFSAPFEPDASLENKAQLWFSINRQNDTRLRRYAIAYTNFASEGMLDEWSETSQGSLALCLLLDRLSRACYRRLSLAFENDAKAQEVSMRAIKTNQDQNLNFEERVFLIFPLIASEKQSHQQLALRKIQHWQHNAEPDESKFAIKLNDLITRNYMVLERFSRFPHRAQQLKIALTKDEKAFVTSTPWQYWL